MYYLAHKALRAFQTIHECVECFGDRYSVDDLLEPTPSPPLSSVLGEIEFGMKPLFESGSGRSESRHVEAW